MNLRHELYTECTLGWSSCIFMQQSSFAILQAFGPIENGLIIAWCGWKFVMLTFWLGFTLYASSSPPPLSPFAFSLGCHAPCTMLGCLPTIYPSCLHYLSCLYLLVISCVCCVLLTWSLVLVGVLVFLCLHACYCCTSWCCSLIICAGTCV